MSDRASSEIFDPNRFARLLRRELAYSYRGLLTTAAAVAGGIIVFSALGALITKAAGIRLAGTSFVLYRDILFLGGFITTSLAFREVWQSGSGIAFLTLPGSLLEKLAAKLLLTSVGFAVGTLVFMSATVAVSEALDRLLFGVGRSFFNPFAPAALEAAARYVVLQSFFLLGSIWFRRLAFFKTVLAAVVLFTALAIVAAIALRVANLLGFPADMNRLGDLFATGTREYRGAMAFKTAAQALVIALAPTAWVAAYFRLGEAEV